MNDYYAILEVAEDANEQEIKKAYRRLAKIYHPDAVGDDSVKIQRMYDIQEAYQCLIDKENRKRYDISRRERSSFAKEKRVPPNMQNKSSRAGMGAEEPPFSEQSQFARFFGFQPTKGNYQEHRTETAKKESPICPEELFAHFFGNTNKGKGRQ